MKDYRKCRKNKSSTDKQIQGLVHLELFLLLNTAFKGWIWIIKHIIKEHLSGECGYPPGYCLSGECGYPPGYCLSGECGYPPGYCIVMLIIIFNQLVLIKKIRKWLKSTG